MKKRKISKVSIVGLGKLGLPLMAAMAQKGYSVYGYDHDTQKIENYRKGLLPYEPGLEELLTRYRFRIRFTHDLEDLRETAITFFVVPTPSLASGSFSNAYLEKALRAFGKALKQKKLFHVLVIVSTVIPGSMEALKRCVEESSGKKCGRDFGLCYNPAFIALGNVIQNFLKPDFVLIGESDRRTGDILEYFYRHFCHQRASIHRMNFINAEISKISLNTFVTMKISFGNTLARLCEKIPGADALAVTRAIGDDRRIGRPYLQGALGYGGPCFPRDNRAFTFFSDKAGWHALSSEATDRINQSQVGVLTKTVLRHLRPGGCVAILGLTYKPDTDVVEESQAVTIAKTLSQKGVRVSVFDPKGLENAKLVLKKEARYASSAQDCIKKADVVLIATAWDVFKNIPTAFFKRPNGKICTVVDCWRVLADRKWPSSVRYIPLGVGQKRFSKKRDEK